MSNKTTSLVSLAPGSLNRVGEKALFYIFHVFPEWLAALTFSSFNLRRKLGAGAWGDYRVVDETAGERERRLKKKAEREGKV